MKNFTNFKVTSSQRKRTMFMFTRSRSKLIILLTSLFIFLSIELYSECVGCGGQYGGNQPCYDVGEIISDGDWYQSGFLWREVWTYIGNCEIHVDLTRNGAYFDDYDMDGGCNCGFPMPDYHEIDYPMTPFELYTNGTTVFEVTTGIDLTKIEVWKLIEGGDIVYSVNDYIAANLSVAIPMSLFQDGQDYIVIGYDLLTNTSTYLSIRKEVDSIEELKIFGSWGTPDSLDIQRRCVTYVSNDSVMIFIQHLDKSGEIFKGSTTVNVGINQGEFADANTVELSQNYPNPFDGSTTIDFTIHWSTNVRLGIYDIYGKEIDRIVDGRLTPGTYQCKWDALQYNSGTYYYQLRTNEAVETKKMVLLK